MIDLKPCPFCGGSDIRIQPICDYYEVICSDCLSRTEEYATEDEAIDVWNNRPSHWYTGTPTEEGWYLITDGGRLFPYFTAEWTSRFGWRFSDISHKDIVAWQKIEPYKEKEDGRTD